MAGLRRALVALAAALALADASIVALALPPILARWTRRSPAWPRSSASTRSCSRSASCPAARCDARRAGFWGLRRCSRGASLGCGSPARSGVLLLFRALQAAGGAAALLAAFQVLDAGESRSGRRLWLGAALVGTAAGPAIGGAADRGLRLARDLLRPGAAGRGRGARLPAPRARGGAGAAAPAGPSSRSGAATPAPGGRDERPARPVVRARRRAGPSASAAPFRGAPRAAAAPPRTRTGRRGSARRRRADRRRGDVASPTAPRRASPTRRRPAAPRSQWGDASPVALAALAFTAAAFTAVLFLLVIELVAGLRDLAAARRAGRLGPAARGARRGRRSPARRGRARSPGRCCSPAARRRSRSCPRRRSRGRSCRSCWPARAWASRCRPSPASCCPSATVGEAARRPRRAPRRHRPRARDPRPGRHRASSQTATDQAILQGTALVLDAQIDPLQKLELAPGAARRRRHRQPARGARRGGRAPARRVRRRRRRLRPAREAARRRRGRRRPGRVPDRLPDRGRARAARRGAADLAPGAGPRCWLATAVALAHRGRLRVRDRRPRRRRP